MLEELKLGDAPDIGMGVLTGIRDQFLRGVVPVQLGIPDRGCQQRDGQGFCQGTEMPAVFAGCGSTFSGNCALQ